MNCFLVVCSSNPQLLSDSDTFHTVLWASRKLSVDHLNMHCRPVFLFFLPRIFQPAPVQQPPFLLFPFPILHVRRLSEPSFPIQLWGTSQFHISLIWNTSSSFPLLPSTTSLTKNTTKYTVNWKLSDLLFYLHKQVQTVSVSEIFKGWISVPKLCICIVLVYAWHLPLIFSDNYCGILKCRRWSFRRVKLIFQTAPSGKFVTIHVQQNMYNTGFALLKYNLELVLGLHFRQFSDRSTGYGLWNKCRAGGKMCKISVHGFELQDFLSVFSYPHSGF